MAEIQDVLDKLDDVLDKIEDNKEKIAEVEAKIDEDKYVYKPCPNCNASGVIPQTTTACERCGSTGFIRVRIISKEEK